MLELRRAHVPTVTKKEGDLPKHTEGKGRSQLAAATGPVQAKTKKGRVRCQEKLVIQRKSKSVNVTGIQNISESVLGDETTHVCSGKMLIILLKAHCVNVNVQSWLSDFTIAKETS